MMVLVGVVNVGGDGDGLRWRVTDGVDMVTMLCGVVREILYRGSGICVGSF